MPPAIPNTPERNEVNTIVAPRMARVESVMGSTLSFQGAALGPRNDS
jgi:hypothetical protein